MRPVNIRVYTSTAGCKQLAASWRSNRKHYLQEALGLSIFMVSACFFGTLLEGQGTAWHLAIPNAFVRSLIMGSLMGATALLIFYSPLTAPSGSHINPAVSITFFRLGKMCHWDMIFYILFQLAGGTLSVYLMQVLLGNRLSGPPVNYVATVPGKAGTLGALFTEFIIAFITMTVVLFTSDHPQLKKYTRLFSGILVFSWVVLAGPLSGFGMNPARSFASALPAQIWTGFWIYLFIPVAGMLSAAEFFLFIHRQRRRTAGEISERPGHKIKTAFKVL